MADKEQLRIIRSGVRKWNIWRETNSQKSIDLSTAKLRAARLCNANLREADLSSTILRDAVLRSAILVEADLQFADLRGADIRKAALIRTDLRRADMRGANLSSAGLINAKLDQAQLGGANLRSADLGSARLHETSLWCANLRSASLAGADLIVADLRSADLRGADLRGADLSGVVLNGAKLFGADLTDAFFCEASLTDADFTGALLNRTVFTNMNLSSAIGLESCRHSGYSTVDHLTLMKSGPLPLLFLRGCGFPDALIEYLPSLLGTAIQFYSCFISYSTSDQEFAVRLHADLQNKGVRCWFAPHSIQAGKKIHEQIDEAIRVYDRLLLILSEQSMNSEWVKSEIAHARQKEKNEKRRVLFPISIVPFDAIRTWKNFDADIGKDSAREIREYFIPDFSDWTNDGSYAKAFDRLLRDLKAEKQASAKA